MTGPEHYREAERLLAAAQDQDVTALSVITAMLAEAQVHATLAAAAATVLSRPSGINAPLWAAVLL